LVASFFDMATTITPGVPPTCRLAEWSASLLLPPPLLGEDAQLY
jgi:hypothetical protein